MKKKVLPASPLDCFCRIASFFVLSVFIVHPLVISPQVYYNITITKLYSFLVVMSVTFLIFLAAIIMYKKKLLALLQKNKPNSFFKSVRPYEYCIFVYWIIMLASALFSDYRKEAFWGSSNRSEGFLMMSVYFLAVVFIGRFYKINKSHLTCLCVVASLVSFYGIFQYYGMDFLTLNPAQMSDVQGPALVYISTMSNRNLLSTYLCVVFCVCFVLFTRENHPPQKCLYLFISWILFYMLLLGQTEAGYMGVLISTAVLFPFVFPTAKNIGWFFIMLSGCCLLVWVSVKVHFASWPPSAFAPAANWFLTAAVLFVVTALLLLKLNLPAIPQKNYKIIWYLFIILLFAAVIFSIPYLANATGYSAIIEANEILHGNFDDSFGSNRMFIWKRTLSMIPENLILGHGPDTFYPAFMERFGAESIAKNYNQYDKAHNEYLQILFDNGILGLLSILSFAVVVLKGLLKRSERSTHAALLLALTCFMVQAFFSLSTPFAHPIIWTLWGFAAAMAYQDKRIA